MLEVAGSVLVAKELELFAEAELDVFVLVRLKVDILKHDTSLLTS